MVSHSGAVLDEVPHPARGPQPGDKTKRLGPTLERLLEVVQLGRAELGRTPGARGPAADQLPVHAYPARDLGLAEPLPQHSRHRQPPPFQGSEIAPYSCRISYALYISKSKNPVTIFYRTQ